MPSFSRELHTRPFHKTAYTHTRRFSLVLMSRLLINLREVAYLRRVVMDSTTAPYSSTDLATSFEMSSIAFEPGTNDTRTMPQRQKHNARPVEHGCIAVGSDTIYESVTFVDEIEMVERTQNEQLPV